MNESRFIKVNAVVRGKTEVIYINIRDISVFKDDKADRGLIYLDPMNYEEIPLIIHTMETATELFIKIQETTP